MGLKELNLVVNMVVKVSEAMDNLLQEGDQEAFKAVEDDLKSGKLKPEYLYIEDAGSYNAVFDRKER